MSDLKIEELKQQLFDERIGNISLGINRLEKMLQEIKDSHSKDNEKIRLDFIALEEKTQEKIDCIKKEQEEQKIDYQKFKSKVLAWAAAGAFFGGILMNLIRK